MERRIGICIATYKNKKGLIRLLYSIGQQQFKKDSRYKVQNENIIVFIVDNDPDVSAKNIVKKIQDNYPYKIQYDIEEKQGIPYVRNKLVDISKDCDIIIFVDDDEEVSKTWIDEMLFMYEKTGVGVIAGPVFAKYENIPPKWAEKIKFYSSGYIKSGSYVNMFYTNNTMINRRILDIYEKPFEEGMSHSGGTDSLLAMKVLKEGEQCVWCNEAIVYEYIQEKRMTILWYLRRRYRIGNAQVYCEYYMNIRKEKIKVIITSMNLIMLSIVVFISSIWYGSCKIIKAAGYFAQSIGMLAGVFNIQYNEYGRRDYR